MTKRSVASVIILSIITLGIYSLVWIVKTKGEMTRSGATGIPSAWGLLLAVVPIVGFIYLLYWYWKWCGGIEYVTGGKLSQVLAFVLIALLGFIGMAIVQAELNKAIDRGVSGQLPQMRVA